MIKECNKSMPLLYCSALSKCYQYPKFLVTVLNRITLMIQYQEIVAIIGSSGSGKSTLLHLIGGLDTSTSGEVFFEGKSLNKLSDKDYATIRNKYIGFVYQFHHLLPDFNILENVAMPLLIGGMRCNIANNRAKVMLEFMGLYNHIYNYPHELSGGESQRVAIARSVINKPILVLADEPTGNLDEKNSDNIMQLLKKLNTCYGTAFIIATHDLKLAKKCHKILILSNGTLKNDVT